MKRVLRLLAALCSSTVCSAACALWSTSDAAAARAYAECHLSAAQAQFDSLARFRQVPAGKLLDILDTIELHLNEVLWPTHAMAALHPDEHFRAVARALNDRAADLYDRVRGATRIYKLLRRAQAVRLAPADQLYLNRWREALERRGVQLARNMRAELSALRPTIRHLEDEFERNLGEDREEIQLPVASLIGVPAQFLADKMIPGTTLVRITSRGAEIEAALTFAVQPATRRAALHLREFRGEKNIQVLEKLLPARQELARLLAFPSFAAYSTQATIQRSISTVEALFALVRRDTSSEYDAYLRLLGEEKRREEGSSVLEPEDLTYYGARAREELRANCTQGFSAHSIGPAALSFAASFFGVRIVRRDIADLWDHTVQAYDVIDGEEVIGRLYLDLLPRIGKPPTPFAFSYHPGARGIRLPEAIVSAELRTGDGLVHYGDARLLLHELGHALHLVFAGHQQRIGLMLPEQDFMEAPAQMLQRFAADERTFNRLFDEQTPPCVKAITESLNLGEAYELRRTLVWAAYALALHEGTVPPVSELWVQIANKYGLVTLGGKRCAACTAPHFGMNDYAATYFVYLQTAIIARQMYDRIIGADLTTEGARFRRIVLSRGGSVPAAQLIKEFLAR